MSPSEPVGTYDPAAGHPFPDAALSEILTAVTDGPEAATSLEAKNVTAVTQMGEGDHGPTDIEIVPNRLLGLYAVETRRH